MSTTTPLLVDTSKLLHLNAPWASLLAQQVGVDLVYSPRVSDLVRQLPAQFELARLAPAVGVPGWRLQLIDCLIGDAAMRQAGRLHLAMARTLYLPMLPTSHPGHAPSERLLELLAAWLAGEGAAEAYIGEAFRYRSAYGTSITAMGTDPAYQWLFEAMPSKGLDCAVGDGCWNLASSWGSFCRHVASEELDWKLLDDLTAALEATRLSDDDRLDDEIHETVLSEVFDPQREAMTDAASDVWSVPLADLVDEYFPAFVGGDGEPMESTDQPVFQGGSHEREI